MRSVEGLGMTDQTARLLRFLLVGGGFSLLYALVSAVLVGKLGTPPFQTSVILYALCIPAAFVVQKRYTFRVARTRQSGFFIYAGTQVACLALVATVTTRFVTGQMILDTAIFLATAALAALLSFAVSHLLAFRSAE
jgi:putative flippase GtrA